MASGITQDLLDGLTKPVFYLEYLINGLFPCRSNIVRAIRAKKREWKFNDKFEYRMLLATSNTSGSLNSQIFKENVGLNRPGNLDFGIFRATYGTVSDGFDVDMFQNLETKEKLGAFHSDYAARMHSTRINVASSFKNFAIKGQAGVILQVPAPASDPGAPKVAASLNPKSYGDLNSGTSTAVSLPQGVPFTIKTPIDVFYTDFKKGRCCIKTTTINTVSGVDPLGPAYVDELYMILENQPGYLTLVPIGTKNTNWLPGEFLEVQGNRVVAGGGIPFRTNWSYGSITVSGGTPWDGMKLDQLTSTSGMVYTSGNAAQTGAMEGLADLFPWYADPNGNRLGLKRPFRDQPNRLAYTVEQAGNYVAQEDGEHIIDALMRGVMLSKATAPFADVGIWINPVTRTQLGYEEGDAVRVIREQVSSGPIIWQRGTTSTDYQIGSQVVREVIEDFNLPTDVILIGPKDEIVYNCWDNAVFQIEEYIQEAWSKNPPKTKMDIEIPDELMSKLDLSNRIIYGGPSMNDGNLASGFTYASNIVHPKNVMPVAFHESGALFTEYPYSYTVVKLKEPIYDLVTT